MRNDGVDLDVRDICVLIGDTGLGICDICTVGDICLHGCVCIKADFDLVVVFLYFAPFDSQQIVFYSQHPTGWTLDHSCFILIHTRKY